MASGSAVKFGTDGWRGVIAEDFTFANVRLAAAAIANYVLAEENPERGVAIGYDTRFGSAAFASAVADVIASAGIPIRTLQFVAVTAVCRNIRAIGRREVASYFDIPCLLAKRSAPGPTNRGRDGNITFATHP